MLTKEYYPLVVIKRSIESKYDDDTIYSYQGDLKGCSREKKRTTI